MNLPNPQTVFREALRTSVTDGTFVKLTLSKYRGPQDIKQCRISPVTIRDELQLRFVFQHATKDITKNETLNAGVERIGQMLGKEFYSGHLFTTQRDYALNFNKRGEPHLTQAAATFSVPATTEHNRQKDYLLDPSRDYLRQLDVTGAKGDVKPSMSAKFKQICRYVEIIASLLETSDLQFKPEIAVTDIGSGKGYLTFALYDYLTNHLGKQAVVRGVEIRRDLVGRCNQIAASVGYGDLTFEAVAAGKVQLPHTDLLIALHACDTATDDAIFHGIQSKASIIVCAPCCQHEIAPQIEPPTTGVRAITQFPLFKQRQADLVTDAARALLLEASGYRVKVLEFISTEHTSKNVMLAGIRAEQIDREAAILQYAALKEQFGFESHHLERLLAGAIKQS